MNKNSINYIRASIIVVLAVFAYLIVPFTNGYSEENVFVVDKIEVEGAINVNFSRDKYIDKAFLVSFEKLMSKILLARDLNKMKNIELIDIKNLVSSFQILEESYRNDEYKATFKITYNEIKIKKLLGKKNISFFQPKNISAIFFPVLFINDEMQDFYENFFYKRWTTTKIKNELINFVLPLEDLEDISQIKKMKNKIEELNVDNFVNKYNIENNVFALMNLQDKKLNVYIKTNFYGSEMSKNISYELIDIKDEPKLNIILRDLKTQINDIWKEENAINFSIPLSLKVKFKLKKLQDLDKLKSVFYKISIIDSFTLGEFNINNAIFEIDYYGNPKKLRTELLEFGYQLRNDQGYWELYIIND